MKLTTDLHLVKNGGAIPPHPHTHSWLCAYLIEHRKNFILSATHQPRLGIRSGFLPIRIKYIFFFIVLASSFCKNLKFRNLVFTSYSQFNNVLLSYGHHKLEIHIK
jgi:hypothetical protein